MKGGLAIVLTKAKKAADEPEESSESVADEAESEDAREASDMAFDALKDDDKDAFYKALCAFARAH